MAQKLGGIDGKAFMLAFLAGFEVECKISEWMLPQHYVRGMHSSGTVGTFGAYAAAAKLLGFARRQAAQRLRHRREFRRRHSLQLRHHDQTASCRPRRGKRRHRRAARGARFHRRPDALDGPWGFLRRARRRRQRRENFPRLRQSMDDRRAGRIDQALSLRRAHPSDDRFDAQTRHRP